jgi:hypothetical protein
MLLVIIMFSSEHLQRAKYQSVLAAPKGSGHIAYSIGYATGVEFVLTGETKE